MQEISITIKDLGKLTGQWDFHVCRDPHKLAQELAFLVKV